MVKRVYHKWFSQNLGRVLSQALAEKSVPHRLAVWPGEAHRARYWREMVQHYL